MKKESAKEKAKNLIGEILDDTKVSCDVAYVMDELNKQGYITQDELSQITDILQTKKE
ncbi:hypothetical protein U2I54_16340 [Bacillus pseudomycoides]|uniref:Uncharacterized protein n=1 Tax=Bacillus bingmayongensis TaxID=1150157 RepID=A0ABU5JZQ5_9BACI|nr:hypothetical protein [Bacillus pseudomycoides]